MRSTARRQPSRAVTSRRSPKGRRRAAAIAAVLFAAAGLAGCAAAIRPPAVAPPAVAGISFLTEALARRDRRIESMRTGAVMEYSGGGQHVKAREEIAMRRPASLRVEAFTPFGVALVVAAQNGRLQIFEPSKNTLMNGTATAATLDRFARIPMAPRDAVRLLMGIVPQGSNSSSPAFVNTVDGMTVATYREADGSERDLGFEGGELVLVRERLSGGELSYEVRYRDYRDIGGVMFPYEVEADFPLTHSHVKFSYNRPIINGNLPDSLFVLTPGPGAKRIDIGMIPGALGIVDG
jgi:outer membrane lipoprotein-sorting protein